MFTLVVGMRCDGRINSVSSWALLQRLLETNIIVDKDV
jgi:hypothetical protein